MPSVLESLTVGHLLDSKPTQGQDVRVVTVSSTQVAPVGCPPPCGDAAHHAVL